MNQYYVRARWYEPEVGRFFSRDPFEGFPRNPNSLHGYSYAEADPVNGTDPSGRTTLNDLNQRIQLDTILNAISATIAATCAADFVSSEIGIPGPGFGTPCRRPRRPASMRVQLQQGGATLSPGKINGTDPPGISAREVRQDLWWIWEHRRSAVWYDSRFDSWLRGAIIKTSLFVGTASVFGGIRQSGKTIHQVFSPQGGYRLDLENLRGWNLRY